MVNKLNQDLIVLTSADLHPVVTESVNRRLHILNQDLIALNQVTRLVDARKNVGHSD